MSLRDTFGKSHIIQELVLLWASTLSVMYTFYTFANKAVINKQIDK